MISTPSSGRRTFLSACLLLSACSSSPPPETAKAEASGGQPATALAGAPVWVTSDCRSHFPGKSVVCGVGAVSGVKSPSLARNAAMGRGRTEIARYLQIEVKSVLRDYQAAKGNVIEQQIEDESIQIAEMTLVGTRMASYFIAPDGTYYALMVLGLEDFTSSIQGATQLEPPLREAIVQHATKAFSSRDDETRR